MTGERILGVDIATHGLGFGTFTVRGRALGWYEKLPTDPVNRLVQAYDLARLYADSVTVVVPEWPMGPSRHASAVLMEVLGAFKAGCGDARWVHPGLTPSEWKKASVGRGNASKDDVRAWALETYDMGRDAPVEIWPSQDVIDAVGIAHAGRAWWESRREAA